MQAEKDNIQERVLGRMAEEKSQNSDVKDTERCWSKTTTMHSRSYRFDGEEWHTAAEGPARRTE